MLTDSKEIEMVAKPTLPKWYHKIPNQVGIDRNQ
jgi:hypothetical protein